jgi:DNA polymerase-3 subunit epsilon
MTRHVVLDTETTGLSPREGHRIVEIGALELINHVPSGESFHVYINPERDMPKDAEAVHGLTTEFLRDKPAFREIAEDFVSFLGDSPLIIHNAAFDLAFLNHELEKTGKSVLDAARVTDTLLLARQKHPMASNSLDALCKRYGIDLSRRGKHGALLDSELLAEVYLELTGGRQAALGLAHGTTTAIARVHATSVPEERRHRPRPLPARLSDKEIAAHRDMLADLGPDARWLEK